MAATVVVADARRIPLADGSVQCVVTSPPYYGLRDYDVDGQIGSEDSLAEFLSTMVDVMREVRRVLRDDGTVWLNMGDSFASSASAGDKTFGNPAFNEGRPSRAATKTPARKLGGFRPKCKMLVPHRLAIALCDDGWILRQDIVWAKPNPMPESCKDRPTTAHEFMFLLTKEPRYYYDAEAVREPLVVELHNAGNRKVDASRSDNFGTGGRRGGPSWGSESGRNKRSVWHIPSHPFPDAHFATFPPKLVEPCIKAGTAQKVCPTCSAQWARYITKGARDADWQKASGGDANGEYSGQAVKDYDGTGAENASDVKRRILAGMRERSSEWSPACECSDNNGSGKALVLDPFAGSGTTGVVARQMGRSFFGVELNPEYAEMARKRIAVEGEGRDRVEQADGSVHEQIVMAI